MGVSDMAKPHDHWLLAARRLRTNDPSGCVEHKSHDVSEVVRRSCVNEVSFGIFDRTLQNEDLVAQSIHFRTGQQNVIFVHSVRRGSLACLEIALATAALAISARTTGPVGLIERKPTPKTLLPFPIARG
jgi:hypothetical protein